jgi:hypothetical protein
MRKKDLLLQRAWWARRSFASGLAFILWIEISKVDIVFSGLVQSQHFFNTSETCHAEPFPQGRFAVDRLRINSAKHLLCRVGDPSVAANASSG